MSEPVREYDTVIRNGIVVNASDTVRADIGIRGERIVAIGETLGPGTREIDASGRYVMPGGIDSHCHIEQRSSTGGRNAESFEGGTRSAACGGTTMVICFSNQDRGGTIDEQLEDYHQRARRACVDYSFHMIINDPSDVVVDRQLPAWIDRGHRSIKLFMTYASNYVDDAQILRVFEVARRKQALVCVHAENHHAIEYMTRKLLAAGLNGTKYHAWAKPPLVEREAVTRIIMLAELMDLPIQIFHVSCAEAAEEILRAQQRGLKIFAETCPQYFVLTSDDLDTDARQGARVLCSPAPRSKADHEALWHYIRTGVLGVVTSDHAPYNIGETGGKFWAGDNAPFSQIANGVTGLETRMPLTWSRGVAEGRIDLQTFVAITSTNQAKLFGLHPRKGAIAVGSDADIVIWDPDRKVTIRQEILHHDTDYTPFEGIEVTGWAAVTLSRGRVVWNEGEVLAEPGWGRFVPRPPYDYIKPRGVFPVPFNPATGEVLE